MLLGLLLHLGSGRRQKGESGDIVRFSFALASDFLLYNAIAVVFVEDFCIFDKGRLGKQLMFETVFSVNCCVIHRGYLHLALSNFALPKDRF
jgi:hypothetical protein